MGGLSNYDALRTATPDTLEMLILVLGKYEQTALERVAAMAQDTKLPSMERAGAIQALGMIAQLIH